MKASSQRLSNPEESLATVFFSFSIGQQHFPFGPAEARHQRALQLKVTYSKNVWWSFMCAGVQTVEGFHSFSSLSLSRKRLLLFFLFRLLPVEIGSLLQRASASNLSVHFWPAQRLCLLCPFIISCVTAHSLARTFFFRE